MNNPTSMPMADVTDGVLLQHLAGDLERRYQNHKVDIEALWRSFDREKRSKCLTTKPMNREDLYQATGKQDTVPEWNLRDMAQSGPDFDLTLLRDRATTSLVEQYHGPMPSGRLGDRDVIFQKTGTANTEPINARLDVYASFEKEGDSYGQLVTPETLPGGYDEWTKAVEDHTFIPEPTARLVLKRQVILLQLLLSLTQKILLDGFSDGTFYFSRSQPRMLGAMEKLTVGESPSELSLADVVASAEEQNRDIKQNFTLLCTEPFILGSTVHAQLNTRAELLADENGKVHTIYGRDKYISGVLLEVVHDAVQQTAISDYTYRLLKLLQDNPDDKAYRAVILQQISNVCHFEYGRVKAAFQRTLHRGVKTRNGKDLFKRQSGALDKFGNPRVKMAFNPGDLAKTDPGLYCLTRFCLPETGYAEGAYWLSKMVEVEVKQPSLGDWLAKMHTAAFCDLVLLLGFIHDLNLGLTLPSTSRQKGQTFVARSQDLATELLALRSEVDIRDFTAPVSALLKPGSSKGALRALDQFIIDKVGTKMGFLYDDLVEECLGSIDGEYEREKVRLARQEKKKEIENAEWIPFPVSAEMTTEKRIEQRREKEKTRPAHASPYDISPAAPPAEESVAESATSVFKVSAATAKVFSTLFDNTQSRGAINWVDFESAMVELRFSIKPTSGSAYTFIPALGTGLKKFNAHRPHQGRIEGWRILHLAKRLTNMYGWGEKTFEIA